MPATEQTWRDSKLLHLVFGISGLAMLATTIWMLAADHRREWKDYLRKFQSIEAWTAEARLNQQESDDYHAEVKQADEAWEATRRVVPDNGLLERFKQAVQENAEARKQEEPGFKTPDEPLKAGRFRPTKRRPLKKPKPRRPRAAGEISANGQMVIARGPIPRRYSGFEEKVSRGRFGRGPQPV